jgi:hypothetical protein
MARKTFVVGIFVMAGALGVLGYQCLTYYFYGAWPAVSVAYVWGELFGAWPTLGWHWINGLFQWIGRLSFVAFCIATSYVILMLSDAMRGRSSRQSR